MRPAIRATLLAALAAACWLQIFFSAVHLDLARDLFVAWRFVHGAEIPWRGPVLAGTIHLGPVYYWLLALLLVPTGSWLGAVALLGLLGSSKIPLAYLLGKELHSRRAGYLFAIGLLVPAWSTFEWLFPGHNLLTTPLTLAFVLCAIRYCRRPRRRYLVGMALAFVLALHAHPTTSSLAWIGLAVAVWAWRKGHLRPTDLLIAAAVGLVPLAPYLVADAAVGFADIRSGGQYLAAGESTGHLSAMLQILEATAFGGTRYWFTTVQGGSAQSANLACLLISACGISGVAGAIIALIFDPRHRGIVVSAFCALFFVLLSTTLLRNVTPYYQTVVLRTMLAGIVAIGLASIGEHIFARFLRGAAIAVAVSAYAMGLNAFVRLQTHGDWPFSFFPLFNVAGASVPVKPFLALPAYAIAGTGEFLCASPEPSAHGALGQQLLHDYAMDMRLACGRSDVKIGGADDAREHWLGLSRATLKELGVRPLKYFGPMGIVAAHPVAFGKALDPQTTPVYPAYDPKLVAPQARYVQLSLAANAHLAISNIAWSFAPDPDITVTMDGRTLAPVAQDTVVRIYACPDCTQGNVDVVVRSADPDDIDIVMF